MNTTLIGLQLLEKEVKRLFSNQLQPITPVTATQNSLPSSNNNNIITEDSLVELIHDTTQSCNVSIEILSDLLLYEKIDGGLLVLDSSEVLLWPFVLGVIKLFDVQVLNISVFIICSL